MVDLHGMVCYSDEMEDLEAAEKLDEVWGNEELECTAQKSEELAGARISDKLAISYRASESPSIYSVTRYGQC